MGSLFVDTVLYRSILEPATGERVEGRLLEAREFIPVDIPLHEI